MKLVNTRMLVWLVALVVVQLMTTDADIEGDSTERAGGVHGIGHG